LLLKELPLKLTAELKKLKVKFEENDHVKVLIPNSEVQDLIQKIKIPLTMIQTHNPTLEDAYVEIVGGKTE
jgi:ABC-2 type transport system ATP-binding protein